MDTLPGSSSAPPPPESPLPPISIPKRPSVFDRLPKALSRKTVIIVGFVPVFLFLFLVVVSVLKRPASPSPTVTPLQPKTAGATPVVPATFAETTPAKVAERLPLTALSGRQLLTVSVNDKTSQMWLIEFTKEGPRKSLLYELESHILELSLSPNRQLLAATYSDASPAAQANKTGLRLFDLRDKTTTDLITPRDRIYRHPAWSSDSLYLSVWDGGSSNSLFDMTTKRRLLDISPGGQISPIVFVPGQAKISYVENGILYESEYSGINKTKILDRVRALDSGIHLYSLDGRFVAFHNDLAQLVLLDKTNSSQQVLAEGASGSGVFMPFGHGLFFNASNNLIYADTEKGSYIPGVDDNPLRIFNPNEKKSVPFFANPKTPVVLSSVLPTHGRRQLLLHIQGFMLFSTAGQLESNCDYTKYIYDHPSSVEEIPLWHLYSVLAPDNKYLFSTRSGQVADASTCAVSSPVDPAQFDKAVWLK